MISITLPSIHEEALRDALDNIAAVTFDPCQVIVVSPFEPPARTVRHQVVWVRETARAGCAAAHAAAARAATGEFITAWADDHLYVDGWDVIATEDFLAREALFHSMSPGNVLALGLRRAGSDFVGTEFGIYYPWFPFMRAADVARVGGWLSGVYKIGFSDSDLGLRVWASGGRCEWSAGRLITTSGRDKRKGDDDSALYYEDDMRLFLSRWAHVCGRGWDTSRLRGFNVDVVPEQVPQVVDWSGRTIYHNDPSFVHSVARR